MGEEISNSNIYTMTSILTKLFTVLLFLPLISSFNVNKKPPSKKTILVVLAHPDDEMSIAEVLVQFSRKGYKVILISATDGKYYTRDPKLSEGDSLATIRREESRCSSEKLGIDHPIFFGIDRLDTKNGVRNYFNNHKQLRDSLTQRIPTIDPEFIITFGPDGDTHHAEHLVVGGAVTEVLLQHDWVQKYPLYYIAWTKDNSPPEAGLGIIDPKYINVEIRYSQEEELVGLDANKCFKSQFTEKDFEEDRKSKLSDTTNRAYFRRFSVTLGKANAFD